MDILIALFLGSVPQAAQEPASDEIQRLIDDLGAEAADARLDARKRLRAIGGPAVHPLKKAFYHENPDVRVEAMALWKIIRSDLEIQASLMPVRDAVRRVRDRWKARDFDDLEAVAREAFKGLDPHIVHYVPKKEIGGRFQAGLREGTADALTTDLEEALGREEGLVCVDPEGKRVPYSNVVLFSLPDRKGWSAYMVVQVRGAGPARTPQNFKSQLLASAEMRQVWGLDPDEIAWLDANAELILTRDLQLKPHSSGGLKIDRVEPGSFPANRGLQAGDIVRDLNGTPVNAVKDLWAFLGSAALRKSGALRVTLEREGKPFLLEFRPLRR